MMADRIWPWMLALTAVLVAVMAALFARLREVPDFDLAYLPALLFLMCLSVFFNGLRIKVLTGVFHVQLGVRESFNLAVLTTVGNHLIPFRGGAGFRAYYLKKKHGFPYTKFVSTMVATYLVIFSLYGLLGFSSVLYIGLTGTSFNLELAGFFGLLCLFAVSVALLKPSFKSSNPVLGRVGRSFSGVAAIFGDYRTLLALVGVELFTAALVVARFYLIFNSVGYDVALLPCVFISIVSMLSVLINLTPAGLGVKELAVSFSSGLLGYGLAEGLLVGVVERFITVSTVFLLSPVAGLNLMREYVREGRSDGKG
ncbi:MAG: hypothetical protein GF416_00390 [Candidatus Altiarchaeales archaeon]|nr:hypothetical protein [Candidatus Altiarchaeales archaeon]MBD3415578.1 hypothetical protein [Candidatus Altiarchaeales archaeon]